MLFYFHLIKLTRSSGPVPLTQSCAPHPGCWACIQNRGTPVVMHACVSHSIPLESLRHKKDPETRSLSMPSPGHSAQHHNACRVFARGPAHCGSTCQHAPSVPLPTAVASPSVRSHPWECTHSQREPEHFMITSGSKNNSSDVPPSGA